MFKVTATLFTIMVASTGLAAAESRPRGLWTMSNGVGGEERFNMSTANIVRGFVIDDETGQADDMYEFKTGGKGLPVKMERDIFRFWSDSMGSTRPLHSIATNDRNGDQRFLLAINAGDPSFSVMKIDSQLGLELKHRQELEGLLPCSLDYHEELGLIAVITCGEEGTLQMFNFDTKTGKTKSTGDTVKLEAEQTKVEQYDFAFSEDTAPAQVSFTPRGEGLVVLYHGEEDNYKGLVYYHLKDNRTVETEGEKGPVTTELANSDPELYPIFNPFGFCTVNSDQIDEGDVLIMLTIAGTWDVSTYKANTKDGKFKKIDTTSAGRFPCWCQYSRGKYYTTNGSRGSMSIGTLDPATGMIQSELDEYSMGAQFNFGATNNETQYNVGGVNLAVSNPSEGEEGKSFLYANAQGLAEMVALDITGQGNSKRPTSVVKRLPSVRYPASFIGSLGVTTIDGPLGE